MGPDGGGKRACTHGRRANSGVGSYLQRQTVSVVNCQLQAQGESKDCLLNGFKDSICQMNPPGGPRQGLEMDTQELY